MKVCIAEKPSVAKEIANVLDAKVRKDGYYEGNGFQITWTFGHLCTLKEPQDYDLGLKRWTLFSLPIIPLNFGIKLIDNPGVEKQFKTIESLVANADEVINCGDAGQEGELIQRWVLAKAKCKAPIKRLWISSLTDEAIRKGFKSLEEGEKFDQLYAAGGCRAIGDWLLGINATRLYTIKYGTGKNVLSVGRVQTPTLAMIVNRYNDIQQFVSKPFWELKTVYRDVVFSAEKGKFFKKEDADQFINKIKGFPFSIDSFEKKEGKESAPKLFDLTSLQVECNKKLNLSADETLKIAQTLYERKVLTYPRVDTRYLSEDIYPTIPAIFQSLNSAYSDWVKPLLGKKVRKSKSVFNDKKVTDHHAIIPTNVAASGLTGAPLDVYEMVVKRFLSNFYDDCLVSKTLVKGRVEEVLFKVNGKQILSLGWRELYTKDKVDDDEKEGEDDNQLLPNFVEGESGSHEPDLVEKQTNPPKLFTEATLLRAMETAGKQVKDEEVREVMKENGIGRPSTRANIIETLFRRRYIEKQRKNIVPTPTGLELIKKIDNELLKSAELTGSWEKKLREIELGDFDAKVFMGEMKTMVKELVEEVKAIEKVQTISWSETKGSDTKNKPGKEKNKDICPSCSKGTVLEGKSAYGCSRFKEGCKFRLPKEFNAKKLSVKNVSELVSKKKTGVIKGFLIDGKKTDGYLVLDQACNLTFELKKEDELTCPKCKAGKLLKGKAAYGCSQFKSGCDFRLDFEYYQKKLTKTQIKQLVTKEKTGVVKGFKTTKGQSFEAIVMLDEYKKVIFKKP